MHYIFFLGTQDRVSRAELLTVISTRRQLTLVRELPHVPAIIVESPQEEQIVNLFNQLGGSIKVARVLVEDISPEQLPLKVQSLLESPEYLLKKDIAWQVHQATPSTAQWPTGTTIRKYLQEQGRKVRMVGKFGGAKVNSATIYHLLPKASGLSLNLIIEGNTALLAQDIAVQDIQTWRRFDMDRPYRDLNEVGMLPPKLARMMINIARIPEEGALWDPFCGTGTILLQGLLSGYSAFGSDINKENVRGAQQNIEWLLNLGLQIPGFWRTFKFDVTRDPYNQEILRGIGRNEKFSAIVSEPYLGPINHQGKVVQATWRNTAQIYETLFQNAYRMVVDGGRLVLVKPVFKMVNKVSRRQKEVVWYNPKVSFNKGRWRLLGQEYADLWWRDNVHAVRRLVMVWEKIK